MIRLRYLLLFVACTLAAAISLVWMLLAALAGSRRAWRIAIGFDQTANAAFGGDEDETISARCWRYREAPHYAIAVQIINLAFWDRHHCRDAYEAEQLKFIITQE